MINLVAFETAEELEELTGIYDYEALWDAGFDMDDWDIGFQSNTKLHTSYMDDEGIEQLSADDDYTLPGHWLMEAMIDYNYVASPTYTEYKGKHYYIVHHS